MFLWFPKKEVLTQKTPKWPQKSGMEKATSDNDDYDLSPVVKLDVDSEHN